MTWLLLLPTLLYCAGVVGVAVWRRREGKRRIDQIEPRKLPPVAIVVAARNEEAAIGRCLDALTRQRYPADLITIYVADDHSTDRTRSIVEDFAHEVGSVPRVIPVDVPPAINHLRGKALAVHAAIETGQEPLILMTDADCAPPPDWTLAVVRLFDDPEIGVVTAESVIAPSDSRLVAAVQRLDWRYLLAGSAFFIELGHPITAMGNNLAFRRAAYEAVGGYPRLPFSVTEDYLLFKSIVERTPWRARFGLSPATVVQTLPLNSLRETYRQRRRWARGGLRAPASSYALYLVAHLAHLLPLAGLFIMPAAAASLLALKATCDYVLLRTATPRDEAIGAGAFFSWQAYLLLYAVTLPLALAVAPRINWKGRRL